MLKYAQNTYETVKNILYMEYNTLILLVSLITKYKIKLYSNSSVN